MYHYSETDGLVLCVVKGKKDVYRWIWEIDCIDRTLITYEELIESINNLLDGNLILFKNGKFRLTMKARWIRRPCFWGRIEWQLRVQKRIQKCTYEKKDERAFYFPREEYDAALKNYRGEAAEIIKRYQEKS